MMLAEIVVDQLVFVLAAPDDVLDPDSGVVVLQNALSRLARLPAAEVASVRQVAEGRLADGQHPAEIDGALQELVLLLDEIEDGLASGQTGSFVSAPFVPSLVASTTRLNRSQAAWRETPRALPISA